MKCDYCGSLSHEQPECPMLVSQSERAMSKATGPLPVVDAVTGGWVPVSSAEALASQWEEDAEKYRLLARQHYYNPKEADRLTTKADTIEELAGWLRRHMEAATVRQPAPNHRISNTEK